MKVGGAVLTTTGTTGLIATTAVAETGRQGILADGVGEGGDVLAFIGGYVSRYRDGIGAPDELEALVDRARNEFNANSGAWVEYGNWLIGEHDVEPIGDATVGVDWELTRGRWPTADEAIETEIDIGFDDSTDTFESLEWLDKPADNPDYQLLLKNHAAESAADELSEFRREYIDGEKSIPDAEYVSRLAGRYSAGVRLGEESSHVLEVLLGGEDHGF